MGIIESVLSTAIIALGGWIISVDRKVTKQETLKELMEVKFNEVNGRLSRIERSLNGHLKLSDHE